MKEVMHLNDESIVKLFEERNEGAIEQVASLYGNYCRSVARAILSNQGEAEDCVTDAYMQAWNRIPPEKPRSLLAYLARITRNLAIDLYRKKRAKMRSAHMELLYDELCECIPDGAWEMSDRLALTEALNLFLSHEPTLARKLFVRRYFYASTIGEIAREYGVTDTSVKTSLCRSRQRLATILTEKGLQI